MGLIDVNNLVFDRVDSKEKLDSWREFAAGFDHDDPNIMTPLINVSRRQKDGSLHRFGYYTVLDTGGIVFPSFHPSHCSPRDFHDMVCAFSNAQCLSSISARYPNGVSHVALATSGLPVGREYVTRLGFENMNCEIHRRIP